ncbi:MAG: DUF5615 family PIN-like protein [Thermomicrobiales bacterium]
MLRFLLDENTEPAITSGLRRRDPMLAVWRVGELTTLPLGTLDPDILRWCEQHNCVLVTNNRHSMPNHLREHVREGGHIPGILTINANMGAGLVIDLLILASQIVDPEECRDQIKHLASL